MNDTTYTPENLKLWTYPDSYMGATWYDYYVFLGRCRDSDLLTRSNFERALELIGGETRTVLIVSANHWAVGWVEFIGIHKSDAAALEHADEIAAALEEYPIVDEEHYSNMEWDEACDYWERASIRDRIELCHSAGESIFAARRDTFTGDVFDQVIEMIRD